MKINVLSDLHLGFSDLDRPLNDADVVVLAGDIAATPRQAVAWAMRLEKPVVYVLGNHEFYGGSIDGRVDEFKQLCAGTAVHVLDDDAVVIDGVRFLGTTLWTDFELFADADKREAALTEAQRRMNDFSRIRRCEDAADLFTPADAVSLCTRHAAWLDAALQTAHAGPTVVVTHHAPSPLSIHPRFADSLLNACFASDMRALLGIARSPLWIHGHTHDSFDYQLGKTRVVCNPRGYALAGFNENQAFDADFIVELTGKADG